MKFSTKAGYGLKAMMNLAADFPTKKNIKEISQEEHISSKYLEKLMGILKKNQLVRSVQGQGGGYFLAKKPGQITAGEIVEILDGPIAPMKCSSAKCKMAEHCSASSVWSELEKEMKKFLYKQTLEKLIKNNQTKKYVRK